MTKNKQEEKPGCAGKDKRGGDWPEWDIKKKKKHEQLPTGPGQGGRLCQGAEPYEDSGRGGP